MNVYIVNPILLIPTTDGLTNKINSFNKVRIHNTFPPDLQMFSINDGIISEKAEYIV